MAEQPIGNVVVVFGTVKAQSADGVERILQPNSPVFLNDRLNTGIEGAISIVFNDAANTQLDLGRMTEMIIDNSVLAAEEVDLQEVTAEVEAIQEALESGAEIEFAETAAGPTAGTGGDGGGGRPIYTDEIDGKLGQLNSGAETVGIASTFTGTQLDPVATPVEEPAGIPPQVSTRETEREREPELFPPEDYDVGVASIYYEQLPFATSADLAAGYLYEFQVGESAIIATSFYLTRTPPTREFSLSLS